MKRIIFLMAAALSLVTCNQNTPDDTKKGGDTQTNQPADPSTWSPVGKRYVCDTTWSKSPAADKYWAWVLYFFSEDSAVWYETELRDLTYNGSMAYERVSYDIDYPNLTLHFHANEDRPLVFKDTTVLRSDWWDVTYIMRF